MNSAIRTKLSIMFFLEYVVWGAWLPLLSLYMKEYLKFDGIQMAWILNAFAIASLTGIFFGGQLADRYFSQEKFLAFSHLVGGLSMLGLAYVKTFWPFLGLMLLHCFFFVPTLSITNAIAFANLKDAQKDFGFIRLWGTIGWIAASWPFIFIPINWTLIPPMAKAGGFVAWMGEALSSSNLKTGSAMEAALTSTFIVSGVTALVLAAFSLFLPRTPPAVNAEAKFAPFEAMKLLAVPSILILFIVTLLDSLVHSCYFFWTGPFFTEIGLPQNWIAPAMSIGQIAEILAMATLGLFLKRLGWRMTMVIGVLGQGLRFAIYSMGTPELLWLVIASNVFHGFAYACFFATVYIFVDETFPKDARASAQGLFNLLILGVGPFLGNFLWGWLGNAFATSQMVNGKVVTTIQFHRLFLVPMGIAILGSLILILFFHPPKKIEPVVLEGEPAVAS
ncbi:MAG: MFS transporter [Isosphaeraceae bacterium]